MSEVLLKRWRLLKDSSSNGFREIKMVMYRLLIIIFFFVVLNCQSVAEKESRKIPIDIKPFGILDKKNKSFMAKMSLWG